MSVDLAGLTAVCFRADPFRTLDYITISPTCRLRKIFTMKGTLRDDEAEESGGDNDQYGHADTAISGTCKERVSWKGKSMMLFPPAQFTMVWVCKRKGAGSPSRYLWRDDPTNVSIDLRACAHLHRNGQVHVLPSNNSLCAQVLAACVSAVADFRTAAIFFFYDAGPNGGSAYAPLVPSRVGFPAGVVPAPGNWVRF